MSEPKISILPESPQILAARQKWRFTGDQRPEFAEPTSPDEESVWDFPRPPAIQPVAQPIRVFNNTQLIAESHNALRVIETAGAPTYYFPPADVVAGSISFGELSSICEWKGVAQEVHVAGIHNAGWRYTRIFEPFAELFEWVSFYPSKLRCFIGDELVSHQPGGYYGGWVSRNLRGPIKGTPGSQGW